MQNYCDAVAYFRFMLNTLALGTCFIIAGSAAPAAARAAAPNCQVTATTSAASVQVKRTEEIAAAVTASNTIDNYNIFAVILNGKQVARKSVNGLNFSTDTKLTKTFNWAIPATVVLGTHKMINPWSWSSAGGNRGIAAQCTTSIQCGMPLVGVNIDGGELNSSDAVDTLHTDYIYPSKAEIDYFASKGLKIIRVPFELSRLELSPGAPLDTTTLGYLKQIVSWAAADGVTVLLDPHDYGYAWGHLIGTDSGDTTNVQFGNFWSEVAAAFKSYPNVAFGIMNEPHVQTAEEWAVSDNAAIAAIRQTGATQEIMVPGVDYTNAGNWIVSRSAAAINPSTIVDPGHNYAFEVHEYLDPNSSGTTFAPITDPDLGVERLRAVTQWAYSTGAKLFLGEFGVPPDSYSLGALLNTLTYMRRNANVWQGIAYFSGGPWWPAGYPFSVEPTGLGTSTVSDAPQMGVLDQFSSPCTLSSPQ